MTVERFTKTDDLLAACAASTRELPEPKHYLEGLPDAEQVLPSNVLLFQRDERLERGGGFGTSHRRFVLLASFAGEGTVILDDCALRLKQGGAVLIHPHQFHRYTNFSGGELCWLFITFEVPVWEHLGALRNRISLLSGFQLACLDRITHRYMEGRSEAVALLTASLLGELRASTPEVSGVRRRSSSRHELINRVTHVVHSHLAEPLQIADIAVAVGLSASHLRARFRAAAGISLGAFVRQTRLHRAAVLLASTDDSVTRVGIRTGFESVYSFSRAFRNELGQSPSRYRQTQTRLA